MVIVHILNSLTIGGREKVVIDLCNELSKDNEVTIITLTNDNNLMKNYVNNSVEVIALDCKTSLQGIFKLWSIGFFKLSKILRNKKPDIIHNHLYFHFYLFLSLISFFINFKKGSFRTVHTAGLFYEKGGLLNRFRLMIEKLATVINKPYLVSISSAVYKNNNLFFKSARDNKLIYNGIDFSSLNNGNEIITRQSLSIELSDFVGIYVSRLDTGKNHEIIIRSVERIRKKIPNIKVIFIGDGILRDHLEYLVKKKKLSDFFVFTGFSTNVPSYLALADFGLFPSSFEGFGISLVEKMYYKLPVIASSIEVFQEIITDNVNGFLFDLENEEKLDSLLEFIFLNYNDLRELRQNAFERTKEFELRTICGKISNYYKSCVVG